MLAHDAGLILLGVISIVCVGLFVYSLRKIDRELDDEEENDNDR